eukprot:TRINITY_DN5649_c0_g1_i1.p1 TRINITY_DN5649_c0_g1~~TRINITY_DN5649_c0_g1_i1.p1  ORF type:complete len:121 (+),score=11.57 TRINITY_DN5649_c0_g1_i1:1-363(+)
MWIPCASVASSAPHEDFDAAQWRDRMTDVCEQQCEYMIKVSETCSDLCGFVRHIYEDHRDTIPDLPISSEIEDFAMRDITTHYLTESRRGHDLTTHELGEKFIEFVIEMARRYREEKHEL